MAKTLEQIREGLAQTYSGPVKTKPKSTMTYIPWHESVKAANALFDIDGYDIAVLESPRREGNGFEAVVRVTVFPSDSRPFYRDGVGFNEVTETRGSGAEMTDTAVKGAASDALNRALKLFGSALGLDLYDPDSDANHQVQVTGRTPAALRPAVTGAVTSDDEIDYNPWGGIGKASAKQTPILQREFSDAQISAMTKDDIKVNMDRIMSQPRPKAAAAAVRASSMTSLTAEDEIPF